MSGKRQGYHIKYACPMQLAHTTTMAESGEVSDTTINQTREDAADVQAQDPPKASNLNKAAKARRVLLVFGVFYVGAVLLLCTPFGQRQ